MPTRAVDKDATRECLQDEIQWALTHGLTLKEVVGVAFEVEYEVECDRQANAGDES
jgi:hypothetical protein